ncbi:MAG: HAMP domain-containing histidine kinase [Oceanospirillaceae bacterium]|nr:HAMP domain-containing histidine kinase [Oceanospirillaceae bacterium]MCP5335770.1 HAMP domain-containing histidine kinase [Oceanospirillaceae bacterium]
MNKISLQVIATVTLLVSVFAVTTAMISAYNSYHNLADLAHSRTSALAADFAGDFDDYLDNLQIVAGSVENNQQFTEALQTLTTNGPLYSLENIHNKAPISDAERTYYLRSQLQLARILINWIALHNLSEIILYQKDPFNQTSFKSPLPCMRMTDSNIYFYSYSQKENIDKVEIYQAGHDILNSSETLFDVSSIYQNSFDFFVNRMGLKKISVAESHIFNLSDINADGHYLGKRLYQDNDNLFAVIWNSLQVKLTSPENWQETLAIPAMLLIKYNPESLFYHQFSSKEKVERSIGSSQQFFYADDDSRLHKKLHEDANYLWIGDEAFIMSKQNLSISNEDKNQFFIYTYLPKSQLLGAIKNMLGVILVITLLSIGLISAALYLLVNRQLTIPLHKLLDGVNQIRGGNLNNRVNITINNEFSTLGAAFNEMTLSLQEKNNAIAEYQNTLEQKVLERTEALESAQQQLLISEKMASLGQLVAGIAHEVNTPLGNCITSLSFVETSQKNVRTAFENKELTSNDFKQFIDSIAEASSIMEKNLQKASELIKTFKKVAVNQSLEEISEFHLQEHVKDVLITLHPSLRKHQVQIEEDIPNGLVLHSYAGALYQVISNIVLNAVRHAFSGAGGHVSIQAKALQQELTLVIEDNGCGMPAEIVQKIFDPFFTTKRGDGGTGLGLYMTYNIVTQQLGGSIRCESQPGRGSRFILQIPLHAPLGESNAHTRF